MANFCPHCGTRVADPTAAACHACGESLPARRGFLARLFGRLFGGVRVQVDAGVRRSSDATFSDVRTHQVVRADRHVITDLDQAPPELRDKIRDMLAAGMSGEFSTTTTNGRTEYRHRGSDGVERVYQSLDEMPPDLRRVFERVASIGDKG